MLLFYLFEIRQRPILPVGLPTSTFGASKLNFCVRNGNRWILTAIITGMAPLVGLEAIYYVHKRVKTLHIGLFYAKNQ